MTLEETHHTLHTALWALHPEVFGATDEEDSELLEAFDEARGDCEIANECAVSGCDDYDCTCDGSDCPRREQTSADRAERIGRPCA